MPVKPHFEWEQSEEAVHLRVTIKGFKKDAVDVFISDVLVKVNAHPTYLLQLDLLHPVVIQQSTFWAGDLPELRLTLRKEQPGEWATLCVDPKTSAQELKERRAGALQRAEQVYSTKLDTRERQKEVEKKRMFNEQWEIEKQVRRDIEHRREAERSEEAEGLARWEEEVERKPRSFATPGDVSLATPPVRGRDTVEVGIDFTAKLSAAAPQRTRGDEDYYRKSRYKPVSIEDAPMFWKDKGDRLYKARDFRAAVDAYSESLKRDGCFLTCVANRAACYLQQHEYAKCIADCDLAITQLANTPASDTTQDRYKRTLMKLHVRRGAAHGWAGDINKALEDYRLAAAYRDVTTPDGDAEVVRDLDAIEGYMKQRGMVEARDPAADGRSAANRLYMSGRYADAIAAYKELLAANEFDVKARSNLSAALLQTGAFQEALDEANRVREFCQEVASALDEPGVQSSNLMDSDDEEDPEDDLVARKREAAATIRERSGHVYLLLKAYVRAGCALCGMKRHKDGFHMLEQALKITPYDDDLRDDANRLLEKMRMDAIITTTKGASAPKAPA